MRAVNFRRTYRAFLTRLEMGVEICKTINRIDAPWSERGTESERERERERARERGGGKRQTKEIRQRGNNRGSARQTVRDE